MGDVQVPNGYDPQLYRLRHSAAHIMAQAVEERFKEKGAVELGIGPPIESGFYYDFSLPCPISREDLDWIEQQMRQIISEGHQFTVRTVTEDEAKNLFGVQPFKLELIQSLAAGRGDEYGEAIQERADGVPLTVYQHSGFIDLCRGPHVERTSDLNPNALKLLTTAGAYWRGDESRAMLTRIYGTVWRTREELDHFLWQREEAERRDHRRLGKELELFHLDELAPGMPYLLPKGLKLFNNLIDFWRVEHEKRGYQEIATPLLNDRRLWQTSGHWDHFRDDMFLVPISDTVTYGLKPMNCPNAMVVFNLKIRSYRDLPLRLSDCDILHRNERSGTLHGLLRVQRFQQDDAHIFVTEDQVEDEFRRIFEISDLFYQVFGLSYRLRLSTRPDKFMGDVESWNKAEEALIRILDDRVGKGSYIIAPGEGAFYGPKIDIMMEDALGRSWQMGTIQLDFQLPRRFNCTYVRQDGRRETPIVIHRVIYGSLERFIGILIEHTEGAFPVWLAPVQVRVITIADRHSGYAREVVDLLRGSGIRCEIDDSNERTGMKIRDGRQQRIPYVAIIGDREIENRTLSVRTRSDRQLGSIPLEDFTAMVRKVVDSKSLAEIPAEEGTPIPAAN